MIMKTKSLILIVASAACLTCFGCKDQSPAEDAGEAIGEAAEEAGEAAGEAVEEGAEKVEEGAEEAGEAVEGAVN